uniref:Serpin domain-containing protein n=1 Tax=Romanomermis culicivorax TaxID=13658 RepID=A0A915JFP3_ROMCU
MSEKLFHENPDQNFVWSPISLEMALAAVMMGANGDTFDQLLERVFNAPDRHYYLTDLVSSLKKTSTMYKSEEATLTYATILALDNFFRVKEHYMKKLKFFYSNPPLLRLAATGEKQCGQHTFCCFQKLRPASHPQLEKNFAGRDLQLHCGLVRFMDPFAIGVHFAVLVAAIDTANFAKDGDMVAASINAMVSDATKKRIQDLIPAKSLSAGTAMILVNAVYFNAKFEEKFERITMDTFYGLNGQKSVEFLTRKFSSLPYYEDRDIKMIILPFVESKFNLYVAIKKNMRRASQQEKRSSMQKLMEMVLGGAMNDKFEKKSVEVQLPKFKIEYTAKKLVENFKSLGVRDLFNGSAANFEQMLEKRHKVAVTNIRHKAFIEVSRYKINGNNFHQVNYCESKIKSEAYRLTLNSMNDDLEIC